MESHPTDPYADMPPEPADDFIPDPPLPNAMLTEVAPVDPKAEAEAGTSGVFAHRETGTLIRIINMDDSYVRYALLDGTGRHSMPRAEYEESFGKWWRPATAEDLSKALRPEGPVTLPKNLPSDWRG